MKQNWYYKQAKFFSTERKYWPVCILVLWVQVLAWFITWYIFLILTSKKKENEQSSGNVFKKGQTVGNSNFTYFILALFNTCLQKYSISRLRSEEHLGGEKKSEIVEKLVGKEENPCR